MKKIILKLSDKLLSNQQLKSIKGGGTPYCFCNGSPVNCDHPDDSPGGQSHWHWCTY